VSFLDVEEAMATRGVLVSYETIADGVISSGTSSQLD
jgi:hypothetical protein